MNSCGNGGIDCTGGKLVKGDVVYLIKDERA
jgi:uncharacterized Zn ribbon protein